MPTKPLFPLLRRAWMRWLAVLVAVFAALAPTLSHALVLARSSGPAWAEVCTSTGTRWVLVGQAPADVPPSADANPAVTPIQTGSPDGQEPAFSLDHCPFCLLTSDCVAPPPHALVHLFAVSGAIKVPTVRQAFLFIPHFALKPPPRGPPDSL